MRDKAKFNQYIRNYRKTPAGKATQMWSGILQRVQNKNGKAPAYKGVELRMTREEFISWVIPKLENWIKDKPIESASIDRINEMGHYEIGNLQLLTRIENTLKQRRYKNVNAPDGQAWCGGCKKYLVLDNFGKDCYNYNSRASKCKTCVSKRDKERYKRICSTSVRTKSE